jgi:hypothetical protein
MSIRIFVVRAAVPAALVAATLAVAVPVIVAFGGACATEPPPRSTKLDPSSPAAAESPPLSVGALSEPPPPDSTDGGRAPEPQPAPNHSHEHEGAPVRSPTGGSAAKPGATLYTCPMHPEVISDKPGKCPKCGMTLVPMQPDAKP